ncbi:phosphate ABC transporter substrate-binding protein PstS [Nanchangia anserum]|uniref:Phosphate-binding protein n=1 Tax=Nanchangia anserum TaxID=2692125 RepID=A0A8I0KPV2_9ACTO|nr:phosphate ABC transporter substrate-binding protein PstS [Nanchangia anserum]QOX82639.1 phosphate ABC transporter substrate-binding protein PstS [Nanchangia anserum]
MRRGGALIVTLTLALGLAACGSDNATGTSETSRSANATVSGHIVGAGASSQEAAQNAWKAAFSQDNPDATITYDPVGSGAGIEQLASGQVNWAGSDAVLEADERASVEKTCGSPALHLPLYVSPVAVVFNLDGIDHLNLDPDTIANIFAGRITRWNDPAIAATNPDATLPDLAITPVHRADESGTTENFTDYLHQAAPDAWPHEAKKSWPLSGGEAAPQTAGVISTVSGSTGTIGYADASQAGTLGTAKLKAGDGYVAYSPESAAAALDEATPASADTADLAVAISRTPASPTAYPLVLVSYEIVCQSYEDPAIATGVKAYMSYLASDKGQQLAADNAGSAPLSAQMSTRVRGAIETITGR